MTGVTKYRSGEFAKAGQRMEIELSGNMRPATSRFQTADFNELLTIISYIFPLRTTDQWSERRW